MIYRLLPRDVLEDPEADARPSLLIGAPKISLALTIVHNPSATTAPLRKGLLPVVVRAYGAYGVCADLSFEPDDLPLLDRCVYCWDFFRGCPRYILLHRVSKKHALDCR
jgi:hypothetical protein